MLSLVVPISMIHLYDRIIPNKGYETLVVLSLVAATAILAEALLRSARRHILQRAGEHFQLQSYACALNVIVNGDPATTNTLSQGHLMSGVKSVERLRKIHTGDTALALLDLPFALLFLFAATLISPMSGLIVGCILLCTFLVLLVARTKSRKVHDRQRDIDQRKASFLSEVFTGIDAIKGLRIEGALCRRYERLVGSSAEVEAATTKISQFAQGLTATSAAFSPVLIACIGAFQVIDGQMTIGALAAVILLTGRIIQPALRVEAYLAGLSSTRMERDEVETLLSIPLLAAGKAPLPRIDTLEFDQVSSGEREGTGIRFDRIDLKLARGECVAITGPDQKACTAFLKLFLDETPISGRYLLNGQDHAAHDRGQRYRQIRYLARGQPLLTGTLMENLTNFQVEEYHDAALDLAQKMGLDRTLAATSNGFNTLVGQGANAGLTQSLTDITTIIAGLVDSPDVVLFDQVNATLDREADTRLLRLLSEQVPHRITLIASARPSFQRLAHRTIDITPFVLNTAAPLAKQAVA